MRVLLLVALAMMAFAANSVLNRMAVAAGTIGPTDFAAIRTVSGAVMLLALLLLLRRPPPLIASGRVTGVLSLTVYMLGFSFAYLTLDAGLGALVLFGMVQLTMFAGGLIRGERIQALRWVGAAIALSGLAVLLWPAGATAPDPVGAGLMVAAGVGWGLYSLAGRGPRDPLEETAANFTLAAPLTVAPLLLIGGASDAEPYGILLAVISGAVTSGLGYALWYRVLPHLAAASAAVAQLTVPLIAAAGGIVLLGEEPGARFAAASLLVIGGVGVSISARWVHR